MTHLTFEERVDILSLVTLIANWEMEKYVNNE